MLMAMWRMITELIILQHIYKAMKDAVEQDGVDLLGIQHGDVSIWSLREQVR